MGPAIAALTAWGDAHALRTCGLAVLEEVQHLRDELVVVLEDASVARSLVGQT